jgi:SPP1 family predicted phage head-tail adaptor
MIEAGKLRHRVHIERPAAVADQYGQGAPPTWETVADVWADVRPLTARETLQAKQVGLQTAYVVTIRYRSDVTSRCRLNWDGRHLYVTSVIDVGARHRELQILASEQEPAGG